MFGGVLCVNRRHDCRILPLVFKYQFVNIEWYRNDGPSSSYFYVEFMVYIEKWEKFRF